MKIAVIGATGTAGRKVVEQLDAQGHDTVEVSRSKGVDVTTGKGLDEALAGVEVVIDASSPWPSEDADIGEFLAGVTRTILQAAGSAGVKHIVYLSITNIDKPEVAKFDYYRAKATQEEVLAQGTVPFSIVRSAQWMEFALNPAAVEERDDEIIASDWNIQPIAVEEVAKVLAEVATSTPTHRTVAGPEPIRLPELTHLLMTARGDNREVTASEPPLASLGDGSLLAPAEAELLGPSPQQWVEAQS